MYMYLSPFKTKESLDRLHCHIFIVATTFGTTAEKIDFVIITHQIQNSLLRNRY